ncbi:MAG: aldehyde ferredoxin oxidoreductase family protein [Chloroflexi bacterium]|nr:aldehyde ferredoxin oxidoreductase family protein [Chloroflexota bacterium]
MQRNFRHHSCAGRTLRVDLTSGHTYLEELEPDLVEMYLGGNGLGARLLWDEVGTHVDPLDPANKLIMATGPLNGTSWPGSNRLALVSKSPLTGMYGDSNAGGFFASELKAAGYDALVLEGRANSPMYLLIKDGQVELRRADHLWGQGTESTERLLLAELGDSKASVACIGPAGERLVRFASVQFSCGHSASRCGMGAVMGSKNLKAVVVRGTGRVEVAHPEDFDAFVRGLRPLIAQDESFDSVAAFGNLYSLSSANRLGRLSARNSQFGSVPFIEDIDENAVLRKCSLTDNPCHGCSVSCSKVLVVKEGKFAGAQVSGLGFEGIAAFGSGIWNDNLGAIVKACHTCDELGLDITSAGRVIAMVMELYEGGQIFKSDLDGLELTWGNYAAALTLLERIALRQGLGDILAEGVKRAARALGAEAESSALHVKGLELPGRDPRAQRSLALAYATSNRGADHLKALPTVDATGEASALVDRYGRHRLPELADPLSPRHKALVVKDGEDFATVVDSVGVCKVSGTFVIAPAYWPTVVHALRLATGMDFDERAVKLAGERSFNVMRCFNILHGASRADDALPDRLTNDPAPSNSVPCLAADFDSMLDEYYLLREWDLESGCPTARKLIELGLEDVSLTLGV